MHESLDECVKTLIVEDERGDVMPQKEEDGRARLRALRFRRGEGAGGTGRGRDVRRWTGMDGYGRAWTLSGALTASHVASVRSSLLKPIKAY